MAQLIDMTGKRFGKLTVIERAPDKIDGRGHKVVMWKCQCDCGGIKYAAGGGLRAGDITSCGCNRPTGSAKYETHKHYKQLSPAITIKDNLIIGNTYHVDGRRVECVGIYDAYARFKRLDSTQDWFECWGYWDLQRRLK